MCNVPCCQTRLLQLIRLRAVLDEPADNDALSPRRMIHSTRKTDKNLDANSSMLMTCSTSMHTAL